MDQAVEDVLVVGGGRGRGDRLAHGDGGVGGDRRIGGRALPRSRVAELGTADVAGVSIQEIPGMLLGAGGRRDQRSRGALDQQQPQLDRRVSQVVLGERVPLRLIDVLQRLLPANLETAPLDRPLDIGAQVTRENVQEDAVGGVAAVQFH